MLPFVAERRDIRFLALSSAWQLWRQLRGRPHLARRAAHNNAGIIRRCRRLDRHPLTPNSRHGLFKCN